ncbi:MAG: signal peptidase I [Candidatus Binatia bacterium]
MTESTTRQARKPAAASPVASGRHRRTGAAPQKSRLRQNIESLLLAVLVALLVRSSVVEAFWVPSGSMLPTIQIGDHLFVNKLAYGLHLPFVGKEVTQWSEVNRNDIVVFTSPVDHRTDLIKRVIAVGGDTVEIRNKRLIINGKEVPDQHASFTDPHVRNGAPRDNFGPVTVPPGKFFVMGDNRDQSYDSRYWGFADEHDVKGKATFIYWSWNSRAGWLNAIRWDRFGHVLR